MENISLTSQIEQALANLALEEIYPSKEMLADIELLDTGKLSNAAFLHRAFVKALLDSKGLR